jgi:AraC family transcriptional regulator
VTSNAERHYHQLLAGVIEDILRCRSGPLRVPRLASAAGLSRFHLVRLFSRMTGETLEQFLRRMRLERAAFMLLNTGDLILEISVESGYQSPEAFSRSFRKTFGLIPTEFRKCGKDWKLESPVGLHWNADWVLINSANKTWQETPVMMPSRTACVWRFVGNYGWLEHGWIRYLERFGDVLPHDSTFLTIYLDNMWTHPVKDTMRADLGWICEPDFVVPKGMRKIIIPAGCYVASRFIDRVDRNDAWSYIGGRYGHPENRRISREAHDIYDRLPVPFNEAKTKVFVGRWEASELLNLSK